MSQEEEEEEQQQQQQQQQEQQLFHLKTAMLAVKTQHSISMLVPQRFFWLLVVAHQRFSKFRVFLTLANQVLLIVFHFQNIQSMFTFDYGTLLHGLVC